MKYSRDFLPLLSPLCFSRSQEDNHCCTSNCGIRGRGIGGQGGMSGHQPGGECFLTPQGGGRRKFSQGGIGGGTKVKFSSGSLWRPKICRLLLVFAQNFNFLLVIEQNFKFFAAFGGASVHKAIPQGGEVVFRPSGGDFPPCRGGFPPLSPPTPTYELRRKGRSSIFQRGMEFLTVAQKARDQKKNLSLVLY